MAGFRFGYRRYFERSAALLEREGLVMAPFAQNSAQMADALEEFHQAVLNTRVVHPGNTVLSSHVLSAAAVRSDRGWKISKMAQNRKIDALVAGVMAHYALLRNDPRSVYRERGLLLV